MNNLSGQQTAPAGWYPHPSMTATLRYWDGARWTDHIAPAQQQRAAFVPPRDNGTIIGACVLAAILPIAGFIWGIVLVSKDDTRGWLPIVVSVCAFGFFVLALTPSYY